ncbi:hypothetical protein CHS0354_002487 [Potamilus streckersoni]|uniref:ABC transporter domain-containing protein n=1 Tax=Potamilus streckersoni TaxID=2493646 RepID=A0AAE0W1L0_9BIVA|nr:hypothetical protein CHS0354_002487 [Potamilus streckersoni]
MDLGLSPSFSRETNPTLLTIPIETENLSHEQCGRFKNSISDVSSRFDSISSKLNKHEISMENIGSHTVSRESSVFHDPAVDKLIEEEALETGTVKASVLKTCAKSTGIVVTILIFLLFGIYNVIAMYSSIWLANWTSDLDLHNLTLLPANSSERIHKNQYYVGVYGFLGGFTSDSNFAVCCHNHKGAYQCLNLSSPENANKRSSMSRNSLTGLQWLAVRLEILGAVVVVAAGTFAVFGRETLNGAIVGLSISYAIQFTEYFNWYVRMTSELETNIVSVERILEYTKRPTGAPLVTDNRPLPPGPQRERWSLYRILADTGRGLKLILKDITVSVKPGEKVGPVGRTGAGKSSLSLALFRLIEPAGGRILVDGVDVSKIGLHDLRSKLTILPQSGCPLVRASFLSRITFWWMNRLVWTGYKSPLTVDDVFALHPSIKSSTVVSRFNNTWQKELKILRARTILTKTNQQQQSECEPAHVAESVIPLCDQSRPPGSCRDDIEKRISLLKVLIKSFGFELFLSQLLKIPSTLFSIGNVILLKLLIDFAEDYSLMSWKGYVMVSGFLLNITVKTLVYQQLCYKTMIVAMQVKTALISAVYNKV